MKLRNGTVMMMLATLHGRTASRLVLLGGQPSRGHSLVSALAASPSSRNSLHRRPAKSWGKLSNSVSSTAPSVESILRRVSRGGSSSSSSSTTRNIFSASPSTALLDSSSSSASTSVNPLTVEEAARQCLDITTPANSSAATLRPLMFARTIPYWDTSALTQFRVVFVLGGPGAGKGTQSNLLRENYPCVHFSVGELLRQAQEDTLSPHAGLIQECLVAGRIVPVEISLQLLQRAMEQVQDKSTIFLVDGFPRNFDNLLGWQRCMSQVSSVWGVLVYTCPLPELQRRILERAETSNRSDDNLQSIQKRFATFERDTMPVVKALEKVEVYQKDEERPAMKLWNVRGDQTLENVWGDTQYIFNQWILHDVLTANAQLLSAVERGDAELYNALCVVEFQSSNKEEPSSSQTFLQEKLAAYEKTSSVTTSPVDVSNAVVEFVDGKKVVVSYDRVVGGEDSSTVIRESRVWSHDGPKGWVNIHFSRVPK